MEFNAKLQQLRKQRGLTQEELADAIFVSRTAISKWESGRGLPNIESLKELAKFFHVSLDELLSGDELLSAVEEDSRQKQSYFRDLISGLLDVCSILLLALPLFADRSSGEVQEFSLLAMPSVPSYLHIIYFVILIITSVLGVATLAMQNWNNGIWRKWKNKLSLILNIVSVLLFVISLQPYAATLLFAFLIIKVFVFLKV